MSRRGSETLNVVITGAAGFIGSHFVNSSGFKYNLTLIDNERSGEWSRIVAPCQRINKDLNEIHEAELRAIFERTDVLIHLAAEKHNSSIKTPEAIYNLNIVSTERLFRIAAESGIKQIIFSSSLYAYGKSNDLPMVETSQAKPKTNYGISKLAGELILEKLSIEYGIKWHAPRFFFIYGPNQFADGGYKSVITKNFERALRNEPLTINGDGEQTLDYVYISDLLRFLDRMVLLEYSSGVTNIASGNAISINGVIELIGEITGIKERIYLPADSTHRTFRFGSTSRLEKIFGIKTEIDMNEGLERIWKEMHAKQQIRN